jgi:hemoglobin/transferrin/lactoferrin receptor protein
MGQMAWGNSPTRRRRRAILLTGAATIALMGAPAYAQETMAGQSAETSQTAAQGEQAAQNQGGITVLDTITVVSRTGETAIDSMASVSQVSGEQLERRMATTPQEVLFGVPGVTVQTDAKRAASSVNIRGLQDFGRVAVIVDGARQNFQRSGHGTQSLFFIDPAVIKQVDVIRGPVANTYGSGAIGGVVFFETKDATDFLLDGETYAGSLTGMYDTNAGGWTTSATGAYKFNEAADVIANIVWRDYGDYKDGGGDRVAGTSFDVLSGMLKSTLRPTENSELKLGWVGTKEDWSEGSNTSDLDLDQNTFTARYNITDDEQSWLDLHINASYNKTDLNETSNVAVNQFNPQTGRRITIPAGARTSWDIGTTGIDIWNTSRFDTGAVSHELTYGGDWVSDDVTTASPIGGSDFYTPSGKRTVWGAYIQEKMRYEWLEVVGALRYDSYDLDGTSGDSSGSRLSPRLTVGVSPFQSLQGLQFYGTYAEGYRSPSISETLISGLHPNGVTFPFLPNPNLKPEIGKTWEAGINYSQDGLIWSDDSLRIKAAYFNNNVTDYIGGQQLSAFDPTSGCPLRPDLLRPGSGYIPICFQYQNFAKAKIDGFEFEAFYDAGRYFGGLSASIIDGYTISNDGEREDLLTVPSSQVTAQLGMRVLENKLSFGGEVQYNAPPKGATFADDYTLVNLFASYQPTKNVRLDFRADNLFDVKYANPLNATTTSVIYEQGLTLKLGATVHFGG